MEFCASVGVDPDETRFAYYREPQGILELFDWVEPDADYQAELLKALRDSWELRNRGQLLTR